MNRERWFYLNQAQDQTEKWKHFKSGNKPN